MSNPSTNITSYLPKFYAKQNQISSILNPLLKNIRESKVSSYKQLEEISFLGLQQKQNQSSDITKKHIFTESPFENSLLFPSHSEHKQKNRFHQKIPRLNFGQKVFSQTKKLQNNQRELKTLDHIQKSRNYSFNLRSKTSDNKKKFKKEYLAPCTADFSRNINQMKQNKRRFLFDNHKNSQLSFDEQLSTYLQLKMFMKGPSFSGGKFSKFKKHLVEEINLQQIQKKFYQNPSTMTNYKHFFQKILNRRKHSQMENYSLNRKNHKKISQIGKKVSVASQKQCSMKQKNSFESIKQSFSQTLEIERPIDIGKVINDQKKRKRSVKAVLFYKKNNKNDGLFQHQLNSQSKSLENIQVTGKKKSLLFSKK